MNIIEFSSFILDDAPCEKAYFDSETREFRLEVDTENEQRVHLVFKRIFGIRFIPSVCYDRRSLYIGGHYVKTVVRIEPSQWILEIHRAEAEASEPITEGLIHYVIPSDDGVWEIVAKGCAIKETSRPTS
ncbi:MAG: hypothetical protein RBT80_10820 [Candidatus Vecturithrix sp.]|jgi:hypothetical protein|nr:hypothetical protein [Candidatus Vecturithrix sp.]